MIYIFEYSVLNGKKDRRKINRLVADLKEVDMIRQELKEKHGHEILMAYREF
jgi:hypothetical protein